MSFLLKKFMYAFILNQSTFKKKYYLKTPMGFSHWRGKNYLH